MLSHIPPTYPAANQPSSPNKCSPSPLASARLPARLQRGTIKLVPRLDLAGMAARKPEDARSNFGKQPKVKPRRLNACRGTQVAGSWQSAMLHQQGGAGQDSVHIPLCVVCPS